MKTTLTFPTTTRTTSRKPANGPSAKVIPMRVPAAVAPPAVLPVDVTEEAARLSRFAVVLHAAYALGMACPELSPAEALDEAELMLATDPDAAPTPAEVVTMVRSFSTVRH